MNGVFCLFGGLVWFFGGCSVVWGGVVIFFLPVLVQKMEHAKVASESALHEPAASYSITASLTRKIFLKN